MDYFIMSGADYYRPIKESYLTDKRLSGDAVRIVNYLAAQKQGYALNQVWLQSELDIGRNKMERICAELRKLGYLTKDRPRRDKNGRLRQSGSVLNWSQVVSTDTLKTRVTAPPAVASRSGRSDRYPENRYPENGGDITIMNPTENEAAKTSERREPPGEAKEEVPASERIKAATTVDELNKIYQEYKRHWTPELTSLAGERKKLLTSVPPRKNCFMCKIGNCQLPHTV